MSSKPLAAPLAFFAALILGGGFLWYVLSDSSGGMAGARNGIGGAGPAPKRTAPLREDPGVTGLVLDPDGEPRPGVQVRLWMLPEITWMPQVLLRKGLSPNAVLEDTTDASGTFDIPISSGSGTHALVIIEEEGCAPLYEPAFDLRPGRRREMGTLRLAEGGSVLVRVLGPDGEPPAQALRATLLHSLEAATSATLSVPLLATRDVRPLQYEMDAEARGDLEISGLPPGRYALAIEAGHSFAACISDFFEISLDDEGASYVMVQMPAAIPLNGVVRDARGKPLEGARVDILPPTSVLPRSLARKLWTATDGTFMSELAPSDGGLTLRVSKPGYSEVERRIEKDAGQQFFLLSPVVTLKGRVVDDRDGAPIPNAWIGSMRSQESATRSLLNPDWASRGVLPVDSAADGSFELPGHGQGSWSIVVKHRDFLITRSKAIRVDSGDPPEPVEIRLKPGLEIDVHVVRPGGRPLAGAGITLHRAPQEGDVPTVVGRYLHPPRGLKIYDGETNDAGHMSFRLLRPGAYRLYLLHRDRAFIPPLEVELDEENPQRNWRFQLKLPGRLHGQLLLDDEPSTKWKVFAYHESGHVMEAHPNVEGEWSVRGAPAGTYVLEPVPTEVLLARAFWNAYEGRLPEEEPAARLVLDPGEDRRLDFALSSPPLAKVQGQLSLRGSGYQIFLLPPDASVQGSLASYRGATIGSDGRFSFDEVRHGEWQLVVVPGGASNAMDPATSPTDARAAAARTFASFDAARAVLVEHISVSGDEVDLGYLGSRTGRAAGQVVRGGAASGPGFLVVEREGLGGFRVEIDSTGAFDIGEVPLGPLQLRVHLEGLPPQTRTLRFDDAPLRVEIDG